MSTRQELAEVEAAVKTIRDGLFREFSEAHPLDLTNPNLANPADKARRMARYLEFLADAVDQGWAQGNDQGKRRALAAAIEINSLFPDQGLPHERLTKLVFESLDASPNAPSLELADQVFYGMLISHPLIAVKMKIHVIAAAIDACRVDGRKNRQQRRQEGAGMPRWEALSAALAGTGAATAAGAIKQAWLQRRKGRVREI